MSNGTQIMKLEPIVQVREPSHTFTEYQPRCDRHDLSEPCSVCQLVSRIKTLTDKVLWLEEQLFNSYVSRR